ncbi:MAG: HMA2 domain-containing protein [Syntrophobacteraceae bacterium]
MNPTLFFSVVSAVAASVWSVWTWREEQQKERQLKRDQESALFVNSLILAAEELQMRLYSMLEENELAFYRKEYPEEYEFGSPYAIEILYRFSQYFGWAQCNYRYGPYTNDPRVIELVRMIGETFENRSKFSGDAFRFTIDERVSLGGAVVRRTGDLTSLIPTFESITLFQFQEELSDKSSKHTPLYQSRPVRSTLAAIDRADRPEVLEGFERLAVLQNLLVDLLTYLEGMEGFRVSIGARRRARLGGSSAQVLLAVSTVATVLHQTPGRIRMGIPRLRWDETYANRLQSLLESVDNVRSIRISVSAASVVINFSPEIPEMEFARKLGKTIAKGFSAA